MSYLEELLPEFRKGAKIRRKEWSPEAYIDLAGTNFVHYHHVYEADINIGTDDWELYKDLSTGNISSRTEDIE